MVYTCYQCVCVYIYIYIYTHMYCQRDDIQVLSFDIQGFMLVLNI